MPTDSNCWEQMAQRHVCKTYRHSKYGVGAQTSGTRRGRASSTRNVLRNSFRIKEQQEKGNVHSSLQRVRTNSFAYVFISEQNVKVLRIISIVVK